MQYCRQLATRRGGVSAQRTTSQDDGLAKIEQLLGQEASGLLQHVCQGVPRSSIVAPAPDHVDRCFAPSDRPAQVLVSLQRLHGTGRLANTGYLSILPVDQGIEHSAAASFAPNLAYLDPENIVRLAVEGGCNAVASTLGVLGAVSRRWAHRIPFIVKVNHNELLTYPTRYSQILFARVEQAWDMGAAAVGATIYFGSDDAGREIVEVSEAFQQAHELGMATVLWCYLRNADFKTAAADYHTAADLTAQANHLGVTIEADIIKQKLPTNNGGYQALKFGKTDKRLYDGTLMTDNPIDWVRWQVANCYLGRIGLINSGGESKGAGDLAEAVTTAVVNKRGGGMGLITGRKAFQRPMAEGIDLFHAIQDVYLCPEITVA
jgi:class I fructose-bisphosphate aldolase